MKILLGSAFIVAVAHLCQSVELLSEGALDKNTAVAGEEKVISTRFQTYDAAPKFDRSSISQSEPKSMERALQDGEQVGGLNATGNATDLGKVERGGLSDPGNMRDGKQLLAYLISPRYTYPSHRLVYLNYGYPPLVYPRYRYTTVV